MSLKNEYIEFCCKTLGIIKGQISKRVEAAQNLTYETKQFFNMCKALAEG